MPLVAPIRTFAMVSEEARNDPRLSVIIPWPRN